MPLVGCSLAEGGLIVNDWLQSIYTIFDRIGNFFDTAYHAIDGIGYVSSSVSGVLGANGFAVRGF